MTSGFRFRRITAFSLALAVGTTVAWGQQQSTAPVPIEPATTNNAPASTQQTPPPEKPAAQPPVGAASAPVVPANGITASEPSGSAIAPAKQKRRFSIAVRIGLIVGAAIAVGAVTAASLSSPSRAH